MLGLTDNRTGAPVPIANPFVRLTTSVPVVTVTVWAPVVAVEAMLMTAVAVVGELTVSETTMMPVPNEAVVVP